MDWLWLIGRTVFGLYFVYSGLNHFLQYQGMKQYAAFKKAPLPGLSVIVTGLMLLAGGASVLANYYLKWGIGLLVVFLVAAAFVMHNFWTVQDENAKAGERAHFLKNLALAAAALMMLSITNWTW